MRSFKYLSVLCAGLLAQAVCGPAKAAPDNLYEGVGRTPSEARIKAWDIAVGPSGKELPAGSGTSREGARIYAEKCAACHGQTGTEGPVLRLVNTNPARRYPGAAGFPYATTVWDYINRSMPLDNGNSLTANEVYAIVAFLMHKNGLIGESDVMSAQTLPKLVMPTRDNFFPRAEELWWEPRQPRKYGLYPLYP